MDLKILLQIKSKEVQFDAIEQVIALPKRISVGLTNIILLQIFPNILLLLFLSPISRSYARCSILVQIILLTHHNMLAHFSSRFIV